MIRRFHIQRNGLSSQSFHKDLHASAKTKHQVKSGLFLDVVVRESTAILKLLPCKDKTLLVRRDAFLILDLSFHVVDGIRRFHIQRNGLSSQSFHKDLHASTKTKHQVKSGLFLDVIVRESTAILK